MTTTNTTREQNTRILIEAEVSTRAAYIAANAIGNTVSVSCKPEGKSAAFRTVTRGEVSQCEVHSIRWSGQTCKAIFKVMLLAGTNRVERGPFYIDRV